MKVFWSLLLVFVIFPYNALALDPINVRMDTADDTGNNTDATTYIGNPLFRWDPPSGTVIKYQWAITAYNRDPWSSNGIYRLQQGTTTNTYKRSDYLSDSQYKFWVQAEGPSDNQWGNWISLLFRIDTTDPSIPTGLTNPANPTTDPTPNVTWEESSDVGGSGFWTYCRISRYFASTISSNLTQQKGPASSRAFRC